MKTKNALAIFIIVLLFQRELSFGEDPKPNTKKENKVLACESTQLKKFSFDGFQIASQNLPKSILVARDAHIFFEDIHSGQLKLRAFQSFVAPDSKIECASPKLKDNFTFNFSAPVLVDLTGSDVVGNSVWQFNIMSKDQKLGMWNQVSHLLSDHFKLEDWLANSEYQILFYQISHDQFELVVRSSDREDMRILVISFDAVKEIY